MGKTAWVDENHYRKTSSDGRTSFLYEVNHSLLGTDTLIEQSSHDKDGTTTAYERTDSLFGILFNDGWKEK